jgi:hypothetical protein
MRIDEGFQQTPPQLGNPWDSDPTLRDIVARYVLLTYGERRRADEVIQELDKDLRRFGDRVHGGESTASIAVVECLRVLMRMMIFPSVGRLASV